ncbi:hypothetical protein DPM19_30825 [Actinomadura craniellae]|uniref:Histidine kinase/HSP90-like ATPase domain-containing protein n=1 Tax=Actinomadura craniellae TaxID=2231787 RepID=A0A365GXC7_9ACTN|nr:ATP-binding protein [Actinomadura craniellae]RAY11418.1 hypothetical protein DPM19_30825 [Actinomadura craniellae]
MPETAPWPASEQPPERRPFPTGIVKAIYDRRFSARADGARLELLSPERPAGSRFEEREVPVSDRAPAQVRRWATDALTRWGDTGAAEDAAIVFTELVTNACQASATRVIALIDPDAGPDVIEVCVWDDAPGLPRRCEPDFRAERGRGLFMVDALAVRWGHHPFSPAPGRPGKVVWADIARNGDGS